MISFVWSSMHPFWAGSGGSENYTAGHIRELTRRGIPARILTLGYGEKDGREDFPDITFKALSSKDELSTLDDTLIFVTYPLAVKTRHQSYAILHCPPFSLGKNDALFDPKGALGKRLITPSKFAAKMWAEELKIDPRLIPAVHPFAEDCFAAVKRPTRRDGKIKILFGGRLMPDKGIYTLFASLHMLNVSTLPIEITATTACSHTESGEIILKLLKAHPLVTVVPAQRNPEDMAALMAQHDIVVMPSTNIFWKEAFGILSVEAQHAGCRVVASNSGGLPETNCGNLILVEPDNPAALANGIAKAAKLGPLSDSERRAGSKKFTVKESVDKLLATIAEDTKIRQVARKARLRAVKAPALRRAHQLVSLQDH